MKIRHLIWGRCNTNNDYDIIRHTYHLTHAQLRHGYDVAVYGLESRAEDPRGIDRERLRVKRVPTDPAAVLGTSGSQGPALGRRLPMWSGA